MTSPVRRRAGALALSATLTLAALAGCAEDAPEADPAADSTSAIETPSPTETSSAGGSATPSPSQSAAPGSASTTVPVYFVGDTPQGPRLFREFRKVPGDDPLLEAAGLLTAGDTLDPDYRTLFPEGSVTSVQATDGMLVVEVPDDRWTTPGQLTRREARLAVQQLVYTLQGVQQARVPVTVLLDGQPAPLFGVDTSAGVENAKPLSVLGLVNLTSPEQGATVAGDTLEASGVASSFEATVPWQIRRDGQPVLDGFATAEGWMGKLYPWETKVDVSSLAPGEYTFVAMTDDPSGGAEGAGPTQDSKDFTLE